MQDIMKTFLNILILLLLTILILLISSYVNAGEYVYRYTMPIPPTGGSHYSQPNLWVSPYYPQRNPYLNNYHPQYGNDKWYYRQYNNYGTRYFIWLH